MQITVSSGNQKVKLKLPCSDAELNATVRDIGLEGVVPHARIHSIDEKQSGLDHMVGQTVNLDELNYYMKCWESLVEYQKKKLCACSENGEYKTLKDMINLIYNESGFYLIDDFKDMKTAGMRIFMDKYGEISGEEMKQCDFEKLARETIEECKSVITQHGVLLNGGIILSISQINARRKKLIL